MPKWDHSIERLAPLRAPSAGPDADRLRHGLHYVTHPAQARLARRSRRGNDLSRWRGRFHPGKQGRVNDVSLTADAGATGIALRRIQPEQADWGSTSNTPRLAVRNGEGYAGDVESPERHDDKPMTVPSDLQ